MICMKMYASFIDIFSNLLTEQWRENKEFEHGAYIFTLRKLGAQIDFLAKKVAKN